MRIDVPGGADCYEARAQDHYHIRCSCCDRLFDAALPYIPELLERERAVDADFEIQGCNLLFVGLCPDCKRKRASEKVWDRLDEKE